MDRLHLHQDHDLKDPDAWNLKFGIFDMVSLSMVDAKEFTCKHRWKIFPSNNRWIINLDFYFWLISFRYYCKRIGYIFLIPLNIWKYSSTIWWNDLFLGLYWGHFKCRKFSMCQTPKWMIRAPASSTRVVRYRHVRLQLPSEVGTPWPYIAQLLWVVPPSFPPFLSKKKDFMPIFWSNAENCRSLFQVTEFFFELRAAPKAKIFGGTSLFGENHSRGTPFLLKNAILP